MDRYPYRHHGPAVHEDQPDLFDEAQDTVFAPIAHRLRTYSPTS